MNREADETGVSVAPNPRDRCTVLEPGVILLREVPNASAESYEAMLSRAAELGADFARFALVLDLSELTVRPRGGYLKSVRRSLDEAVYLATTQPRSTLLRVAAGFMIGRMMPHASMHSSREEAVEAARSALARYS